MAFTVCRTATWCDQERALTVSSTGPLVLHLLMSELRYKATCIGFAGKASKQALETVHFFQRLNAPLYFLTVVGALLRNTILGRASASSFSSGSSMTSKRV